MNEGVGENGEFGHMCIFFDIGRGILHDREIRLVQVSGRVSKSCFPLTQYHFKTYLVCI